MIHQREMATRQTRTRRPAAELAEKTDPQLKVFGMSVGFYDTVVAAPSQAAALRAWGTRQNLFKDGTARLVTEEKATKAALTQPGVVLRRPIGTKKPFGLDAGVPQIPDLPRSKPAAKKAPPKPVYRKALDRAEAELSRLESRRRSEQVNFDTRRRKLEAEEAEATSHFEEAQTRARERVEHTRRAYLEAGGKLET
ncbi:hypothetical protein [Methylobacterium gnaphalii]|uniref:Cell envelope biogenesis protein TolA n=1 Tax=Methylobacterium gnaphalii TaxID=1010610 RepID=A0A512JQR8_9HYPH|nr:hypothetical protein [Methylobacterium gnaphalii]GEP12307.1 hypothetical protein MGN01_41520 [Methylobacterium gnaphalii]GJD70911.1 hypothetical protein MMMDOFMJ_3865 [Methylobacterium gnaphalii]GLS50910.1 hypothetical protein GCM10007885_37640 [Methylobacterium gnaphalii]